MGNDTRPTFAKDPEKALALYKKLGYHIEPNVWSLTERQGLIRAGDELPSAKDGTHAITMNPHNTSPVFLAALSNRRMVAIMELLISGKVSGIQTQFFFCKPGTPGFARHQDNHYVEAPPDAFASAWAPLVDVAPGNGTLIIYPGSHLEPLLPVEAAADYQEQTADKNSLRHEVVLPAKYEPMDVVLSAGDVVFFHGHLIHSSHTNASADFRRVLLCTYVRRGEKFRAGVNARRSEVDVYAAASLSVSSAA